ncbi:MAG: hypothetical protein WCI53_11880 [Bacteroidota bacterium]|jgi:hypothetical protein
MKANLTLNLDHFRFPFLKQKWSNDFDLSYKDALYNFNFRFRCILQQHFVVFISWSILNCFSSLIVLLIYSKNAYYFWLMNGAWGIFNFGFAIILFYHTLYQKNIKKSPYKSLQVQNHVTQMLFLNCGIDLAHILLGFCLREHSLNSNVSNSELFFGFGWAIVVQGFFLLTQDILFLYLHHRNFRKAKPIFETLLDNENKAFLK